MQNLFNFFPIPCVYVGSWVCFEVLLLHSFSLCSLGCWDWECCKCVGSWLLVYSTSQCLRLLHLPFQGLSPGAGWTLDGSVNTAGVECLPSMGRHWRRQMYFKFPQFRYNFYFFLLEPDNLVLCGSHFSGVTRLDQCGVVPISSKQCLPKVPD